MQIDEEKCTGCGRCAWYCPVRAISVTAGQVARIDFDECVECGSCLRSARCPTEAIYLEELAWPRAVRRVLSDPLTITEEAGIAGRGTEEMKTNDVTGRFKRGQVGVGIEMGRPALGSRFRDVEKVTMAVARLGVEFEVQNPTTSLMSDRKSGKFRDDILNEKVLSAIIEFAIPMERLAELLDVLRQVSGQIDTVFSLCLASRVNLDGSIPTGPILEELAVWHAPNGKTNVGLGRPLYQEK
jgi:NAD-dependent dihydropyrimidine dehydrogenase PreA subunit